MKRFLVFMAFSWFPDLLPRRPYLDRHTLAGKAVTAEWQAIVCLSAPQIFHRSVSDAADALGYAGFSVRDMARFGFLFSRLA